ncbi:hypothetical protein [uncultured Alteromonas sp.]|jgi:hypothetical protein|uniref:hypothetical protein n=1 Tax=uncultured Alteromonas sp. TaxID=179113 RepID=UPI0025F22E80|nr:hypothetical protein [uncultured Alteromonas sp.]
MDIRYVKQHGDFVLTMVNDIVLVNAKGPWNTECVENFGLTYAGTVYKSGQLRWADIVMLSGESLLVPEAERALTERIGRAVAAGLGQVYIVTEKSRTAATSVRQIKKIYAPHSLSMEFVSDLDMAITLARTAGFAVDAEQIRAFFA